MSKFVEVTNTSGNRFLINLDIVESVIVSNGRVFLVCDYNEYEILEDYETIKKLCFSLT